MGKGQLRIGGEEHGIIIGNDAIAFHFHCLPTMFRDLVAAAVVGEDLWSIGEGCRKMLSIYVLYGWFGESFIERF